MKRYLKYPVWLVIPATVMSVLLFAANIEWNFHNEPILWLTMHGERIELGLRDDGVVVWRKITQTTNSPSEHVPEYWPIPKPWTLTNIVITNIFIDPSHWWSTNGGVIDVQKEYYDDLIPKVR